MDSSFGYVSDKNTSSVTFDPLSSLSVDRVKATSRLNSISNPSGIPILDPKTLNAENAKVTCASIVPSAKTQEDLQTVVTWTIRGVDDDLVKSGKAQFWDTKTNVAVDTVTGTLGDTANNGNGIFVFGNQEGRVVVEVHLGKDKDGEIIASYEAIVVSIKKVPFRVQLLYNGTDGAKTRTLEDAKAHIAVANIYLRQIGIELVPDSDADYQPKDNRTAPLPGKDNVGYFFNKDADAQILQKANFDKVVAATKYGHHPGVVQIVYIQSISDENTYGATTNHPDNMYSKTGVKDKFVRFEGQDPEELTMNVAEGKIDKDNPELWGFAIANLSGDPKEDVGTYGHTIAHELLHVLGLEHRSADADEDRMPVPDANKLRAQYRKNLIYKVGLYADIDAWQLIAARGSDLFKK